MVFIKILHFIVIVHMIVSFGFFIKYVKPENQKEKIRLTLSTIMLVVDAILLKFVDVNQ